MVLPEVVAYLQENLPKFPVEELRRQLGSEGVSEIDFSDSLAAALRAPRTETQRKPAPAKTKAAQVALIAGLAALGGASAFFLARAPSPESDASRERPAGESGFVGPSQWVVRLPEGYAGTVDVSGPKKSHEAAYFAPRGTDPTNFLSEGLYGQLGIVRLEVFPSPFPDNPTGVSTMSQRIASRLNAQGEKYAIKNIQVGALPGVQVNVFSPFPRVEGYILGKSSLYRFYAGQEDAVWRDIVLSLRDARSEN